MRLSQLSPASGSTSSRRRIGRGGGSGRGTTAGKGTKGQKSRSGGIKASYRGMSSRMQRYGKLPGFHNKWRREYAVVRIKDLDRIGDTQVVDAESLRSAGLLKGKSSRAVKVVAGGNIARAMTVRVDKVTKAARSQIEAAGGRVEVPEDGSSST